MVDVGHEWWQNTLLGHQWSFQWITRTSPLREWTLAIHTIFGFCQTLAKTKSMRGNYVPNDILYALWQHTYEMVRGNASIQRMGLWFSGFLAPSQSKSRTTLLSECAFDFSTWAHNQQIPSQIQDDVWVSQAWSLATTDPITKLVGRSDDRTFSTKKTNSELMIMIHILPQKNKQTPSLSRAMIRRVEACSTCSQKNETYRFLASQPSIDEPSVSRSWPANPVKPSTFKKNTSFGLSLNGCCGPLLILRIAIRLPFNETDRHSGWRV